MATQFSYYLSSTDKASDVGAGDRYGCSVSVSANGLVRAIGAYNWDSGSSNVGVVYIDDLVAGAWVERGKVESPEPVAGDLFGWSVSLNSDGSQLTVGQPYYSGDGAIFTLTWGGSSWSSGTRLDSPSSGGANFFGSFHAQSSDGTVLIVQEQDSTNLTEAGVTGNVFAYDWVTSAWVKRSTDLVPVLTTGSTFGSSLFLSSDGEIAFVGNYLHGTGGEVEIYDYTNPGWTHRVTFESSDVAASDLFGGDVVYAESENKILVGAGGQDFIVSGDGVVYLFTLSGSTVTELGFLASETPQNEGYAGTLGVDSAYTVVVVGEISNDTTATDSGAVYSYDLTQPSGISTSTLPLTSLGFGETTITGNSASTLPLVAAAIGENGIGGIGSDTLSLTASATGKIYTTTTTGYVGAEYELPTGWLANTGYLGGEYALDAMLKRYGYLGGEYTLNAFKKFTAHLGIEYNLDAFIKTYGFLGGEYAVDIFTKVYAYLGGSYALDAFLLFKAKLGAEYTLDAFESKTGYLGGEYSVDIFKKVIAHLGGEYNLSAFEKKTGYLGGEYELDVYKIYKAYLGGEYSIDHFVKKTGFLGAEYDLDAYLKFRAYIGAEYNLDAYEAVYAFLGACYELDANEVFYAFATNLETGAITEYTNFNFNSVSGDMACTDTGLFRLTGSDDDGTAIDASIETGKFDFGSSMLKRLSDAYLSISSDGNLTLTVTTESGTTAYTLTGTSNLETLKADLASGHEGRYWTIKVENVTGSTMELDSIELLPQILSRRV